MEERNATVTAAMLRVGAGVNVVGEDKGNGMPPVARLIVVRLRGLPDPPPPAPVAPPIGPDVQPVAVIRRGNPNSYLAATWSPDGTRMVIGMSNNHNGRGPAHLWDAKTMLPLVGLVGDSGGNRLLQFSPNGKFLAGSADATLDNGAGTLWNGESGARITSLPTFGSRALSWSPDSKYLAILQRTGATISRMYDGYLAKTGTMATLNASGNAPPPPTFALKAGAAPDPQPQLLTAIGWDKEGFIWSVAYGKDSLEVTRWQIAGGTGGEKYHTEKVSSVPLESFKQIGEEGAPVMEPIRIIGFSSDASLLAGIALFKEEGKPANSVGTYEVRVWNSATGKLKARLPAGKLQSKAWMFSYISGNFNVGWSFSPGNDALAIGDDNGVVMVWDLNANGGAKLCHTIQAHQGEVSSVAWSPDGRVIATGGQSKTPSDGAIHFWKANDGTLLVSLYPLIDINGPARPPSPTAPTTDWLALAPDGRVDASTGAGPWLRWRVGKDVWPWDAYIQPLRHSDLATKLLNTP